MHYGMLRYRYTLKVGMKIACFFFKKNSWFLVCSFRSWKAWHEICYYYSLTTFLKLHAIFTRQICSTNGFFNVAGMIARLKKTFYISYSFWITYASMQARTHYTWGDYTHLFYLEFLKKKLVWKLLCVMRYCNIEKQQFTCKFGFFLERKRLDFRIYLWYNLVKIDSNRAEAQNERKKHG